MSKFRNHLQKSGVLDLVIETDSHVCYTGFSDSAGQWTIVLTNGESVWKIGLQDSDVEDLPAPLEQLRECLENGNLQVLPQAGGKMILSLSCPAERVDLDLFELPAAEKKLEIKSLVFSLAKNVLELQTQVKEYKQQLTEVLKQKEGSKHESLMPDLSGKGGTGKSLSRIKKPAGHSLINPSSKRRKAAAGVVFGDEANND